MRRTLRTHWVLVTFLAIGTALRAAMFVAVPKPLMSYTDANVYVSAAQQYLFRPVDGRTAGYPLALRVMHGIWSSPVLPIIVQHLSVLLASVALYAVMRSANVSRALAGLGAGVWLISIDWLWLEHQLLTETFSTVLVVAAIAVLALAPTDRFGIWRVALAAGALAGALGLSAVIVRPAALIALPGVGLVALLLLRAPIRARLASAAALTASFFVLLFGYLVVQDHHTHFGMRLVGSRIDMGLYPGIAPVAKCDQFTPPPGTRPLCERTPPSQRPTNVYYYWDANSPGRRLLAARPDLQGAIKLWASRAENAQRWDDIKLRLVGLQRLFGLGGGGSHRVGDQGTELETLRGADTNAAPVVVQAIQSYYGKSDAPNRPGRFPYGVLTDLQSPTRPAGLPMLLALVLAVAGAFFGRGRARLLVIAVGTAGWLPALATTWTGGLFNWRYILATLPLISVAAFGAISALAVRRERTSTEPSGAPADPAGLTSRRPLAGSATNSVS